MFPGTDESSTRLTIRQRGLGPGNGERLIAGGGTARDEFDQTDTGNIRFEWLGGHAPLERTGLGQALAVSVDGERHGIGLVGSGIIDADLRGEEPVTIVANFQARIHEDPDSRWIGLARDLQRLSIRGAVRAGATPTGVLRAITSAASAGPAGRGTENRRIGDRARDTIDRGVHASRQFG